MTHGESPIETPDQSDKHPTRESATTRRTRIAILGAAGRDFHNFNVAYRNDPTVEIVAFTATQIPGIEGRRYPPALSGALYPEGITILSEQVLDELIVKRSVDRVVFAYSDVSHEHVMHVASRVIAAGADFALLGPKSTMLHAGVPVIAVSAVRTGCGKSQVARYISRRLRGAGHSVAVIRHPMPYGDLEAARAQRFAGRSDLDAQACTIEEREEYEPHLAAGNIVYAGVDYGAILARAESEADLVVWDGGNNDFPFVHPDLHIVLVDALRPGHEVGYHPGEAVLRMADVVVLAKADTVGDETLDRLERSVRSINARALLIRGASPIVLDDAASVRGKRVIALEDGPTITHGGMAYGAAYRAAKDAGAAEIVDPRPWALGDIAKVYLQYPHIGPVLPAMGYSPAQVVALEEVLNATEADVIVAGTPIDIAALVRLDKPVLRARYEFAEMEEPGLWGIVDRFAREQRA